MIGGFIVTRQELFDGGKIKMNGNLDDFVNEATGKNADSSSLTGEQLFAIRRAAELGKRLQEDFPEIADRYRNGMTQPEISLEYCIQELYDTTSRDVALAAVHFALGGYDFGGISYPGLIEDPEERRNIGLEHNRESGKATYEMRKGVHGLTAEQQSENGRKNGKAAYEMRKGIHGMTPEQRSETSRKGGKALYETRKGVHGMTAEQQSEHGKALYEMGLGIHGMTTEQRRENGRKNGKAAYEKGKGIHGMTFEQRSENSRKNVIAKGLVPWVPAEETNEHYTVSEVETAYRLAQCPEYRRGSLINNARIAGELNTIFHNGEPVRKGIAVGIQLSRYQKNVREVIS